MSKIYLHGRLGRKFGREWELKVKTIREMVCAFNANTKNEFCKYLLETAEKGIDYNFVIGEDIILNDREDVGLIDGPIGGEDVHIFPIVKGKGIDPVSLLIQLVVAIVMAVVSALMAPDPQVDFGKSSDSARKDSYLFSGGLQPAKQGKPLPVGYGEMIIHPIPISVRFVYGRATGSGSSEESPGEGSLNIGYPGDYRQYINGYNS